MQKKRWFKAAVSVLVVRALVLSAFAQDLPAAAKHAKGRGSMGFESKIERSVGLTPEQRDAVRGLLAQQHQQLQALRESYDPKYAEIQEQTDSKIRTLLNPDQQKKFDALLAQQKQARGRFRKTS